MHARTRARYGTHARSHCGVLSLEDLTAVKPGAVVAIAKALETNTGVKIVYLHGTFIGDEGAVALAKMLRV